MTSKKPLTLTIKKAANAKYELDVASGTWSSTLPDGTVLTGTSAKELDAARKEHLERKSNKPEAQENTEKSAQPSEAKFSVHLSISAGGYDTYWLVNHSEPYKAKQIDANTGEELKPQRPMYFEPTQSLSVDSKLPKAKLERIGRRMAAGQISGQYYQAKQTFHEKRVAAFGGDKEALFQYGPEERKETCFGHASWPVVDLSQKVYEARLDEWKTAGTNGDRLEHRDGYYVEVSSHFQHSMTGENTLVGVSYIVGDRETKYTNIAHVGESLDMAMRLAQRLGQVRKAENTKGINCVYDYTRRAHDEKKDEYFTVCEIVQMGEAKPILLFKSDGKTGFVTAPSTMDIANCYITRDLDKQGAVFESRMAIDEAIKSLEKARQSGYTRNNKATTTFQENDRDTLLAHLETLRGMQQQLEGAKDKAMAEMEVQYKAVMEGVDRAMAGKPVKLAAKPKP